MSHIERGFCTRIDSDLLDELREEKLEFPRRLEQLTKESIMGNYMKYLPSPNAETAISGWHVEKETPSFKMIPEEFPDLSTTAVDSTQSPSVTNVGTATESERIKGNRTDKKTTQDQLKLPFILANKTEIAPISSSEKKVQGSGRLPIRLLSDINRDNNIEVPSSVQRPQPVFKSGVNTVVAGMDPDDPNNPSFNVARYRCPITEKWNCPKIPCR